VETWIEEEAWEKIRDKMSSDYVWTSDKRAQERKSKKGHYYSSEQKRRQKPED